jgi:hypothetical protein
MHTLTHQAKALDALLSVSKARSGRLNEVAFLSLKRHIVIAVDGSKGTLYVSCVYLYVFFCFLYIFSVPSYRRRLNEVAFLSIKRHIVIAVDSNSTYDMCYVYFVVLLYLFTVLVFSGRLNEVAFLSIKRHIVIAVDYSKGTFCDFFSFLIFRHVHIF